MNFIVMHRVFGETCCWMYDNTYKFLSATSHKNEDNIRQLTNISVLLINICVDLIWLVSANELIIIINIVYLLKKVLNTIKIFEFLN